MPKRLIETELVARLADIVDIQPVVASRPQDYPLACYTLIGDLDNNSSAYDVSTLTRELFQIDVYSPVAKEAKSLLLDIQTSLLTWDNNICVTVSEDGMKHDQQDGLHRYSKDFYFTYQNTALPYPECSTGLCWFDRHVNVFTDVEGTTAAGIGQAIARWDSVGGDYSSFSATQEEAGARPRLSNEGVEAYMNELPVSLPYAGNSGKFFNFASTLNIANDFTIYSIHKANVQPVEPYSGFTVLGGQEAYPHWYYQPHCYLNFGSGWFPYSRLMGYGGNYSNTAWTVDTPYVFSRVRRHYADGQWKVYIQLTNTPEAYTNVNDGWTYPFNYLMHSGLSPTQAPPDGFHLKQLVIVNEDAVVSGLDLAIRAKLFELEGIDL